MVIILRILSKEESEKQMKEHMNKGILKQIDLMKNGVRKCTILTYWKEEIELKENSISKISQNIIVPINKEEINGNSLKKLDSDIEKRALRL